MVESTAVAFADHRQNRKHSLFNYFHVEKCCALVCASPELFLTKPRTDLNITLKSRNWSRLGTVIIRAVECLPGDFLSGTRSLKYISPLDIFPPVLCFLLCLRTGRKWANASQTLRVFLVPDFKLTVWLCTGGYNTI